MWRKRVGPAIRGFTYIGLLILIAMIGMGLALTGQVWHMMMQREKERELMFVGDQFRNAFASFHRASPDGAQKFPRSLEALLDDSRSLTTKRHLRRIYPDPMTGRPDWGLVTAPDGSITGVYSQSDRVPVKKTGFPDEYERFAKAQAYSDWQFEFAAVPAEPATSDPVSSAAGPPVAAPVPVASEAAANAATPTRPGSPDDADERREMCKIVLRTDQGKCNAIATRHGAEAAETCRASAAARNQACLDERLVPALEIPHAKG